MSIPIHRAAKLFEESGFVLDWAWYGSLGFSRRSAIAPVFEWIEISRAGRRLESVACRIYCSLVSARLLNRGLFKDLFVREVAELPYNHQDMVIVYGFNNPNQMYYTHISVAPDPHAHNCFIVNNADRVAIGKYVSPGITWGVNQFHHLRIVRKGSTGETTVYFDDMSKPIMKAEDKTFPTGYIGFGSFDDTGKYRNIRVYAPDYQEKTTDVFKAR